MTENQSHWTARSTKKFLYRIASDFIEQLRDRIDALKWSQKRLAKELRVTEGRISQVLNNPGNLTLETMVDWARILGMKVSIIAYFDKNDPNNELGPVNAEIFRLCWEKARSPRSFLEIQPPIHQQMAKTDRAVVRLTEMDACSIIERKTASNEPSHARLGAYQLSQLNFEKMEKTKEISHGRAFTNNV